LQTKSWTTLFSQLITNSRKLLFTHPCPSCGMLIQKEGGCKHMTCSRCNYEFCWSCFGHYQGYRHDSATECGQVQFLRAVQGLMFIVLSCGTAWYYLDLGHYVWQALALMVSLPLSYPFIDSFIYLRGTTITKAVAVFITVCILYLSTRYEFVADLTYYTQFWIGLSCCMVPYIMLKRR